MKRYTCGLWLAALSIPVLVMATELPSQRYQLALDPAARPVQTPVCLLYTSPSPRD